MTILVYLVFVTMLWFFAVFRSKLQSDIGQAAYLPKKSPARSEHSDHY